jgi:hypothetical protein
VASDTRPVLIAQLAAASRLAWFAPPPTNAKGPTGASVGKRQEAKTTALTEVNAHILDVARESLAEEVEWEFFCECGQPDCAERITLTLDAFIGLHEGGRAVLAPGHHLSQADRARQLRADAETLRRQARYQLDRAKKNPRRDPDHPGQ